MEGRLSRWLTGRFPVVTLRSPMPQALAANRLQWVLAGEDQARRQRGWLRRIGGYADIRVTGRYVNGQLVLRMRGAARNSWRPDIAVELVPLATGGSLVRLHPRSNPAVTAFMCIWFGLAVVFAVIGLVIGQWITLIMQPLGVGVMSVGRMLAGAEIDEVGDWVAQCVEASG